ncbi:MAG TPA: peptide-methionine (S)-S-oxide reductase MsrA [Acidimicrobiales bacterium]|nr:peptide-methionine (S)-S-oxide reductase MsrA [Acidimicrobiales bacterium]
MRYLLAKKLTMVEPGAALPGRPEPIMDPGRHFVLGTPIGPPYPDGAETAQFALGCFWGAERAFWGIEGVITTAVGYAGGYTENPTYEEVCSGRTGHTESVLVAFDPAKVSYADLLQAFFEHHDPTQFMRQGNDIGTQYRSAIFTTTPAQAELAAAAASAYGERLAAAGFGELATEITPAGPFYFAEDYHQQYLAKNPDGYCGLGGTGVSCPVGLFSTERA